ncbi:DegT/DnrJ/EryC1/StrS family aminotransferase [Desulfobacter vibrioformis]|uniref:DegT/DnrJ/EryC1/StrS family aminotransferase n=1 Tax=Desulfobacter vibrioformis TaxID=34031 RepID=UPI003CCBB09F
MRLLDKEGIESRLFFIPLHHLPPFREESRRCGENLPITDDLSQSGMNLTTYTQLENVNLDRITQIIRS